MVITGKHVAAARGLLGLTQGDLCQASGVSRKTLVDWEAGTTIPRAETVTRVRDALERRGILFLNGDSPGVRLKSGAMIPV